MFTLPSLYLVLIYGKKIVNTLQRGYLLSHYRLRRKRTLDVMMTIREEISTIIFHQKLFDKENIIPRLFAQPNCWLIHEM